MADSAAARKPLLVYSEEDYPVYEKRLYAELINNDRSNKNLLINKYEELNLPEDPIRKFESTLTADQKDRYDTMVANWDSTVPTKLEVLQDPEGDHVTAYKTLITTEAVRNGNNKAVTAAKLEIYEDAEKIYLREELCHRSCSNRRHQHIRHQAEVPKQ